MFKIKRIAEPKFAQGHRYELWQQVDGEWVLRAEREPTLFSAELVMARYIPAVERFYDEHGRLISK